MRSNRAVLLNISLVLVFVLVLSGCTIILQKGRRTDIEKISKLKNSIFLILQLLPSIKIIDIEIYNWYMNLYQLFLLFYFSLLLSNTAENFLNSSWSKLWTAMNKRIQISSSGSNLEKWTSITAWFLQ